MPKKVERPPVTSLPQTGYIRASQLVPHIIPIGRNTLLTWVREGSFPPPVRLGPAVTAWRAEDVRKWMEAKQ